MLQQAGMHAHTIGKDLRTARRSIGLSQAQLSSLLGLTQARVSLWETGQEDIPTKHRQRIVDLFLNTRGQISPLIEAMLRSNPDLAVTDKNAEKILRESPLILQAFGLEKSEVEGAQYARIFNAEWKNSTNLVYDFCSISYCRDVELANTFGKRPGFRCRLKLISVGLEGYDKITIRQSEIIGPSGGEIDVPKMDWVLPSSFETGSID